MRKEVSVIIPNFNNASWLPQCLDSCLAQAYIHEIVVVDDHSQDNSWEILTAYQQRHPKLIKLFKNPEKGGNQARRFGFEQATGTYIQWLDADDLILPEKFAAQLEALEQSGGDVAYSDWRLDTYQEGRLVKQEKQSFGPYPDMLEELLKDNWTSPNNYLLRRGIAELLHQQLGWNSATPIGQDREYFTKAAILGAKFVYVPGVYAVYNRWSTGTVSGMPFKQRLEHNQQLEGALRKLLLAQEWISAKKKKDYAAILDTHKVKACFYHAKIRFDRPISFFSLRFDLMHYKMRLVMPFVYMYQSLRYFLSRPH